MAPHIVAWGPDEGKRPISPAPSTVGSIVSIESIASDSSIIPHSTSEVTSRRSTDFTERKVPPGVHLAVDSPFVRHEKYFFQDGNITFLVREMFDYRISHRFTLITSDRWHPLLCPPLLLLSRFRVFLQ